MLLKILIIITLTVTFCAYASSVKAQCPPQGYPDYTVDCGNGYCCPTNYPICGTGADQNQCFSAGSGYTNADLTGCYGKQADPEMFKYQFDGVSTFCWITWNSFSGETSWGGQYQVSGSQLQLNYDSGDNETHSLFISPDKSYIQIDGTNYIVGVSCSCFPYTTTTSSISGSTTTTTTGRCPPGYPIDCGNGWCCPASNPICGTGADIGVCFLEPLTSTTTSVQPTTSSTSSTTTSVQPTTTIPAGPSCAGVAPASAARGATRDVTITGSNTNFEDWINRCVIYVRGHYLLYYGQRHTNSKFYNPNCCKYYHCL